MNTLATVTDSEKLARNLRQLAEEASGRNRRIALRRAGAGLDALSRRMAVIIRVPYWWVAPASWAVVLGTAYALSDALSEQLGAVLAHLVL